MKKIISLAVVPALAALLPGIAVAQEQAPATPTQKAAYIIETGIQDSMSQADKPGQPSLTQLGGVLGGSTSDDASGAGGSDGGAGGGGGGAD